jgi:hypothetical protein
MENSVQTENSGLSGLQVCPPLESCRPSSRLRKIIIPVDLTKDCPASIDYGICFAKAHGSSLNLLYLYQEPYVVDQSFRSRGCDLFREQRRKVFADFYKLLRETHAEWIFANAPCPVLVIREGKTDFIGQTASRRLTQ